LSGDPLAGCDEKVLAQSNSAPRNLAEALRAMIMTLPWLVPIVLLIQVIRLLWRFLRRRGGTERRAERSPR